MKKKTHKVIFALLLVIFLCVVVGVGTWREWELKRHATVERARNVGVASSLGKMEVGPLHFGAASSTYRIVARVLDGDTIELQGGERVRYIGIDAPEEWYSKKATTTNTCYGDEAKKENEWLVLGKKVRLVPDTRDRDVYGRLLRYVYVDPPLNTMNVDETFVNSWLVADGAARATPYPPDTRFKDYFSEVEQQARQQKAGLWGKCGV